MAGSYNHVVDKSTGNLKSNEDIVDTLETGGDVFEAVEEMYGMIWYLANLVSPYAELPYIKRLVENARDNYKQGLQIAKEVNSR